MHTYVRITRADDSAPRQARGRRAAFRGWRTRWPEADRLCRVDAARRQRLQRHVWPQVWRMLSTPISAPRCRGSARTSRSVAALVWKSHVPRRTIPIGQRQERMREREDDVHIRDVEELLLTRLRPTLRGPPPSRIRTGGSRLIRLL